MTALALCVAVPLLLAAQLAGSFVSYDTSATALCEALQGEYDQSLRTGTMYEASGTPAAVEGASSGAGWPAQIDRATQMTRDRCPDRTLAVTVLERRMVSGTEPSTNPAGSWHIPASSAIGAHTAIPRLRRP